MGSAQAEHASKDPRRVFFEEKAKSLLSNVLDRLPLDFAADKRSRALIRERLPVALGEEEEMEDKREGEAERVSAGSHVRLVRGGIARLLEENGMKVCCLSIRIGDAQVENDCYTFGPSQ